MTLLTALVGGLACGYLLGWRPRAVLVWLAVWAVVLPVQTRFLVAPEHAADWSYWPVQAGIVVLALGMLRLGAAARARRAATGAARPDGGG
jgi:hypothetical protein